MQIYFPARGQQCRRRLSTEARKDLRWWGKILEAAPERSITQEHRERVYLWSDAAGTKGLGAYYHDPRQFTHKDPTSTSTEQEYTYPRPGCALSIALPRYLARANEHINTKKLRAVEQALLYWGETWRGTKVLMCNMCTCSGNGTQERAVQDILCLVDLYLVYLI